MAKKLLAVVLAVLIAVSAMAVTVFADKQIPLYKTADTKSATTTYTFDIPVYGLYGYLTAGDYMKLDLPTDFGGNVKGSSLKWSVSVNGMTFSLENGNLKTDNDAGIYTVDVVLAYLTHDFDGKNTAIPQTTSFNTVSSIRLIAELTTNVSDNPGWDNRADGVEGLFTNNYSWSQAKYLTKAKAQWYKADGTEVPGSLSYVYSWNPQKSNTSEVKAATYDFVTREWSSPNAEDEYVPLTWDHTLGNRAALASAEAVELVVELNKNIVGQATYSLYANSGDATYATNYQNLWWQYDASRKFVSAVSVDGKTDKLVFNVPLNILYDADLYGTYNRQFVIFENITLLNTTIMKDYLHIDRDKVGGAGAGGTMGRVSWVAWGGDRAKYDGEDINYARTGISGKGVEIGYKAWPTPVASESFTVPAAGGWFEACNEDANNKLKITEDTIVVIHGKRADGQGVWGWGFNPYRGMKLENIKEYPDGSISVEGKDVLAGSFGFFKNDGAATAETKVTVAVYNKADLKGNEGTADFSGEDMGSDVMAKAIYLNIKETEATPAPDATPDTPTEAGDNTEDLEGGDNVNVEDNAPAKEDNPKTGVALAVVPMLVAAVAAVLAKKH